MVDLLLLPVVGPVRAFAFVLDGIRQAAEQEVANCRAAERLMEARVLLELGEMSPEEYERIEGELAPRLDRPAGSAWGG